MPQSPHPRPRLRSILCSSLYLLAALGLLSLGCNSAAQTREKCALDAARALPLDDPDQISVGDARQFGRRIKACLQPVAPSSPAAPDAGG